jgi:hypothetical protein
MPPPLPFSARSAIFSYVDTTAVIAVAGLAATPPAIDVECRQWMRRMSVRPSQPFDPTV